MPFSQAQSYVGGVTISTVSGGGSTPAYARTPVAGSLLVLKVAATGTTTAMPATPTGWQLAHQRLAGNASGSVFWRIATGDAGDNPPTITVTGGFSYTQLSEHLGQAANPADQGADAAVTGAVGTVTATAGAADAAPGDLVVAVAALTMTASTQFTAGQTAIAFNNGATDLDAGASQNDTLSTLRHYHMGWGITSGNAGADTATFTYPTTNANNATVVVVSFQASGPTVGVTDITYNLGGGAANTDPNLSLGGAISNTAITPGAANNVWADVTSGEEMTGDVYYKLIYVKNNHTTATWHAVVAWIDGVPADGSAAIALDSAAAGATAASSSADRFTAPSPAVTFSSPVDKASGLSIGDLGPGQYKAIWLRRTIPAGAAFQAADAISIRCEGTT